MIDVWGADHGGYVSRMKAVVKAVSDGRVPLEIVLCQIVHVMRGGQQVRMSKRAGTFVTLRDLLDEVGRDAVRFTMLMRKSDAQMEFDLDQAVAQTRKTPSSMSSMPMRAAAACCAPRVTVSARRRWSPRRWLRPICPAWMMRRNWRSSGG